MPIPPPRQRTLEELTLQLEDASGRWYVMNYAAASSQYTEQQRTQALSWLVGCRMELHHFVRTAIKEAANQSKETES